MNGFLGIGSRFIKLGQSESLISQKYNCDVFGLVTKTPIEKDEYELVSSG